MTFLLPEHVLNTMAEARAQSTRWLYTLKWSIFSAWCQDHDFDLVSSDMSVFLSFLLEMLDKQRSSSPPHSTSLTPYWEKSFSARGRAYSFPCWPECTIGVVLSSLQERLERRLSPSKSLCGCYRSSSRGSGRPVPGKARSHRQVPEGYQKVKSSY